MTARPSWVPMEPAIDLMNRSVVLMRREDDRDPRAASFAARSSALRRSSSSRARASASARSSARFFSVS